MAGKVAQVPAAAEQQELNPDNGGGRADAGTSSSDDDDDNQYMLGFVEAAPEPAALLRHRFPSKLGGRPAWLDPVHLPTRTMLACPVTGRCLNFLLQLYAPLCGDEEEQHEAAFHRTVFLFATPGGAPAIAHKGAVRAFRCQLPRANPFYAYDPPGKRDVRPKQLPVDEHAASLAADPWRVVEHERRSGGDAADAAGDDALRPSQLFPERELVVEPEQGDSSDDDAGGDALTARLMAEYQARVAAEGGELDDEELPPEVLDMVEQQGGGTPAAAERAHFAMFQARITRDPDQVIRYCFQPGARPLWPSRQHVPDSIPPCPHCGAPRRFEFQVMPALLNELGQDELAEQALDWGTLVVYSCPASCQPHAGDGGSPPPSAYIEEFVWVQPAM